MPSARKIIDYTFVHLREGVSYSHFLPEIKLLQNEDYIPLISVLFLEDSPTNKEANKIYHFS